jgi:hypothetical protein
MTGIPNYSQLVVQAEEAVAGVKDPDLKRIAFQKILDSLIPVETSEPKTRPAGRLASNSGTGSKGPTKGGPKAYVQELVADNFFKNPKTISEVKSELENSGHHIATTSLSGPLQTLCQQKTLRRKKHPTSGAFNYSNW